MKALLRSLIAALPGPLADRIHAYKHRRNWLKQGAQCHAGYLDQYQTRNDVIALAQQWLKTSRPEIDRVRVLEFGCSAANNLKLLRELIDRPIDYWGFDVQPIAIEMGQAQFPDAHLIVGDEVEMLAQMQVLGDFHIFLASGILAYLPQAQCQEVLSKAARCCEAVLVCDDLTHFNDEDGENDGLFLHPYARLCRETGLRPVLGPTRPGPGSRYSSFLAVKS